MATAQISSDQLRLVWQKHQKNLNFVVVALLAVYLIAYAADLFWRFIPPPTDTGPVQAQNNNVNTVARKQSSVNLNAIKNLKLFGDAAAQPEKEPEPVTQDAPETNLNLTLTGLVASTIEQDGAAIIENNGSQNTYGIGDKVDGTNAIVREVMNDRIIISNGGRAETLMLDGYDFTKAAAQQLSSSNRQQIVPDQARPNDRVRKPAARRSLDSEKANMARALRQSPAKFTDFISIQPFRKQGKIAGYKVNPGRQPELFKAAGLKAGDVLTEINGLDLTDIQQSMQAMNMLRTAEFLQITLSRDGQSTTLDLELPAPDGN